MCRTSGATLKARVVTWSCWHTQSSIPAPLPAIISMSNPDLPGYVNIWRATWLVLTLLFKWLSHPSIHQSARLFLWGLWGSWSQSQLTLVKRWGTPWTGCHQIKGPIQPFTLTLPPNLHVFGLWEEAWVPGWNLHTHTGRTCKVHTERPRLNWEPSHCERVAVVELCFWKSRRTCA